MGGLTQPFCFILDYEKQLLIQRMQLYRLLYILVKLEYLLYLCQLISQTFPYILLLVLPYTYHQDIGFSRIGPSVPAIDLVLQKETVVWSIIGANSMVQVTSEVICLGFVDAGSDPSTALAGTVPGGSSPETSVTIGAHQLENNLLQFDLGASRLGFSSLFLHHTNCANFNFTSI